MSVKISRILHAGYIFEKDGCQITFDPIFENPFSVNCYAFPAVNFDRPQISQLRLNAVFISHFHDDHCSLESLSLLDRSTPIYLYCVHSEVFDLIRQLGFKLVYSLILNTTIEVGPFQVTVWPALDRDVDSIFQIQVGQVNILNVVDSWIDPLALESLEKRGPWDMILWPFQTMREVEVLSPARFPASDGVIPEESIEAIVRLNPRLLVPSSCQFIHEQWSWYRLAYFPISYQSFGAQIQMRLPLTQLVRLNPSRSIELSQKKWNFSSPLSWVEIVGSEDSDYSYEPTIKPQSTADIAKHFVSLDNHQKEKVFHYCQHELAKRINKLDPFEDPYFQKTFLWRLNTYDYEGQKESFCFQISKGKVSRMENAAGTLGWQTEIPLTKLYGALFKGESLSSIYIRINDIIFDSITEKELKNVDLLQDPLLCSLFNRSVAAYQHAQLKRIQITQ